MVALKMKLFKKSKVQKTRAFCQCCGKLMEFETSTSFVCYVCKTVNDLSNSSSLIQHELLKQKNDDASNLLSNTDSSHPIRSNGFIMPDMDTMEEQLESLKIPEDTPLSQIDLKYLKEMFDIAHSSSNYQVVSEVISYLFSHMDVLNNSFLMDGKETSIDFVQINDMYTFLKKQPPMVLQSLMAAIEKLLSRLHRPIERFKDCRFLLILLQNPLLLRKKTRTEINFHHLLLQKIFGYTVNGAAKFNYSFVEIFAQYPETQLRNLVEATNHFLYHRISKSKSIKHIYSDWSIISAAKFMSLLSSANSMSPKLPVCEFYNTAIDGYVPIEQDYIQWHSNQTAYCFCQYPFLISMGSKLRILQADAKSQMDLRLLRSMRSIRKGKKAESPFLTLAIRRDHLVSDSLNQISKKRNDLKKKLKVQFVSEDGVDAGGISKEWLLLLTRELFLPQYGMFLMEEETRLSWFNHANTENDEEYFLIGVVFGLAIYNSHILDVHFPLALYKKLLQMPVNLYDLAAFKPSLASGLKQLLEYEGPNFESVFERNFVITVDTFGQQREVELIPNGRNIVLTRQNREMFAERYVDYIFTTSVKRQFEHFQSGFNLVCAGNALALFRADEIELLICGNPDIDVNSLKSITEYEGFIPDEEFVQWYWEILQGLSESMKKKFMLFVTGTDRMPAIEGTQIRIKLTCIGDDSERLPVAHTCFNQLGLYRYSSLNKFREKLMKAITESEGFGIK